MNRHIKTVHEETTNFLQSTQNWANYETISIIAGVLYAVFNMIYFLAPSKKAAKKTIKGLLRSYHNEL